MVCDITARQKYKHYQGRTKIKTEQKNNHDFLLVAGSVPSVVECDRHTYPNEFE